MKTWAVVSSCGTRDGAHGTLCRALDPAKENNYALESLNGYIVLGCWELKRKFRFHSFAASHAADGSTAEQAIQNVEANVPARCAPTYNAAIDFVPKRQARASAKRFEFPPNVAELKQLGSVGLRYPGFGCRASSYPGELHRGPDRSQVPIGVEGRPLAQMRWIGNRL
jgi:hypothetical protein